MRKGLALPILAILALSYLAIQTSFKSKSREKLDDIINSEYQEARPLISGDGQSLYFVRRHHPDNFGGSSDFQDVWMSRRVQENWTTPVNLSTPVNNKKSNTLCSISDDGKTGFFLDSYRHIKTPLSVAEHTADGWQKPQPVEIKDFVNLSSFYDFHHHPTLKVLLMAVDNGRGYGDQDLHISFLQEDGSYSAPINLGPTINSRKADFAPFLAQDGQTLFFSSFGHQGMGGSDIYVSKRLDESWRKWSPPVNLGSGVNSELDENYISVTADLQWAYFESYAPGSSKKDLFRATLDLDQLFDNVPTEPLASADSANEVLGLNTTEPTDLTVNAADNIMDRSSETSTAPKAQLSRATAKSETESNQKVPINPSTLAVNQPPALVAGALQSKIIGNLYFTSNSYTLPSHYQPTLDKITEILKNRPGMEAYIEGHTDNLGPAEVNLRISHLRAQSAAHYVLDQGISANRLHILGKGETEPLASNDDEAEGRELNRRVEIVLSDGLGAELTFVLR